MGEQVSKREIDIINLKIKMNKTQLEKAIQNKDTALIEKFKNNIEIYKKQLLNVCK